MKVKYQGESFGADGLTDGAVYVVLGVEFGNLRIVDDSGEDYLYSAKSPSPMEGTSKGGRWEIIEDDTSGTLRRAIEGSRKTA